MEFIQPSVGLAVLAVRAVVATQVRSTLDYLKLATRPQVFIRLLDDFWPVTDAAAETSDVDHVEVVWGECPFISSIVDLECHIWRDPVRLYWRYLSGNYQGLYDRGAFTSYICTNDLCRWIEILGCQSLFCLFHVDSRPSQWPKCLCLFQYPGCSMDSRASNSTHYHPVRDETHGARDRVYFVLTHHWACPTAIISCVIYVVVSMVKIYRMYLPAR